MSFRKPALTVLGGVSIFAFGVVIAVVSSAASPKEAHALPGTECFSRANCSDGDVCLITERARPGRCVEIK